MRSVITVILLVISIQITWGQSARLESAALVRQGDNARRIGDIEQAIIFYTRAIENDNTYAEAYMKRAYILEFTGQTTDAMKDYNKAIALNPQSEIFYNKRAALKMIEMDYKGALTDIDSALNLNSGNDSLRSVCIDDCILMGEYEKALDELDLLIKHEYLVPFEHLKRALAYFFLEDLVSAKEEINIAIDLSDSSSIAIDLLGLIYLKERQFERAIESFNSAIKKNPDFALAYYNRSLAYMANGRKDKALEDLNMAIAIRLDLAQVLFQRALVKKESGDWQGAIDDYNKVLTKDTSFTNALFNRAYLHKFMGNYGEALADANKILELEPYSADHWNLKGNIQLLFGDHSAAVESYSVAIQYQPQGAYYYNRGIAYIIKNLPKMACEDFSRAIDLGHHKASESYKMFCGAY